jgi:intracellular sulfur oxidation DsrE/DsrF family protein
MRGWTIFPASIVRSAVYKELLANVIPNGHIVAAGVLAVGRSQEYGYALLTAL